MAGPRAGHPSKRRFQDGWPGQAPAMTEVFVGFFRYKRGMDEFGIISRYFAPLAGEGAFGLKDDAALLPARVGHDLIVTTDTISEGTDFFAFDPADLVAQK